jgi:hypothetical protein
VNHTLIMNQIKTPSLESIQQRRFLLSIPAENDNDITDDDYFSLVQSVYPVHKQRTNRMNIDGNGVRSLR